MKQQNCWPIQAWHNVFSGMDFQNIEAKDEAFVVLIPIDHELHHHAQLVHHMVERLNMVDVQEEVQVDMGDQLKWLEKHLNIVTQLNIKEDEADELLCWEVGENIQSVGQVLVTTAAKQLLY